MKVFKVLVILAVIAVLLAAGAGYYLLTTTAGSELLLREGLKSVRQFRAYGYQQAEGNLLGTFTLSELIVKDLEGLSRGNECRVGEFKVSIPSVFKLTQPVVTFTDGRLKVPGSQEIVFYGVYSRGSLDLQLSAPLVTLSSFSDLVAAQSVELTQVEAQFEQASAQIRGPLDKIQVRGSFLLREGSYRIFYIRAVPVSFDLECVPAGNSTQLFGEVELTAGTFSGPKGAALQLQPGRISFDGDPRRARLQVRAQAVVDEYTIIANLGGSIGTPELSLRSEPELSREQILLLLATGKSLKSLKDLLRDTIRSYK